MKTKSLVGVIALIMFTLFMAPAARIAAGLFEWSRLGRLQGSGSDGPEPYVSAIAPHPTNPAVLYAGTLLTTDDAVLVYRSGDGGASWAPAGIGLPDLPLFFGVNDLIFLPGSPDVLYVALDAGGVWRTGNGGATWEDASGGSIDADDTVTVLAATPGPPAAVYALTASGVHVSIDGDNWRRKSKGLPAAGEVVFNDLALDANDPDTLYVATNPAGLFRSADGGEEWAEVNGDLPGVGPDSATRNVRGIAVSPLTGEVFLSLRGAGLFRSADGGRHWTLSHTGITYTTTLFGTVGAPVLSPTDPNVAYVFNSDGIYRSEDGGATWALFDEGFTGSETLSALAFHDAQPHTIYAGTSISGVWALTIAPGGRYFVPVVRR